MEPEEQNANPSQAPEVTTVAPDVAQQDDPTQLASDGDAVVEGVEEEKEAPTNES